MRFLWSHVRNILITGGLTRTRIVVPLYGIVGDLKGVRRVGEDLIIDFGKNTQKLTGLGLDTPDSKKHAVETRDPSSLRQAYCISNGEEWAESSDRYD